MATEDTRKTPSDATAPRRKAKKKVIRSDNRLEESMLQAGREATKRLGETSDEYPNPEDRDLLREDSQGDEIARQSPDVVQEGPGGMNEQPPSEVYKGFASERDRRD